MIPGGREETPCRSSAVGLGCLLLSGTRAGGRRCSRYACWLADWTTVLWPCRPSCGRGHPDHYWRRELTRLIRTFCTRRPWHTCTGSTAGNSCRVRSISIRQKSDLHCSRCLHCRPGTAVRQHTGACLLWRRLVRLPSPCRWVRGEHASKAVRPELRCLPGRRSTLVASGKAMESSKGGNSGGIRPPHTHALKPIATLSDRSGLACCKAARQ